MKVLSEAEHKRRRDDVAIAIDAGHGFRWLAQRWDISTVAAWKWCGKYATEDECATIGQNGRMQSGRPRTADLDRQALYPGDRLALLDMCVSHGWTLSRIAQAIGLSQSTLYGWVDRNAPDGIRAALLDYQDDAERHTAKAA